MRLCQVLAVLAVLMSLATDTCSNPPPRRRQTKDGRVFLFDACSKAWRLETPSLATPGDAELSDRPALPWSQFHVSFDGQFEVAGIPILLGDNPDRRPQESQEHADTGSSIWDGAVALAKVLEVQPFLVRGRQVLELGAGRGLAGLAAWGLGAELVILTDLAYTLEAMERARQLTFTAAGDQV
ncbi:Protein N-lysine methyltransferase METTL21A (HSPA lysine methyltransferase) (HSPA-KMT) (Hepatocellular carcinoma-associated antigen 557b) (Methyltransferase-like protein 21A), partial [Durusdinium trenchii]